MGSNETRPFVPTKAQQRIITHKLNVAQRKVTAGSEICQDTAGYGEGQPCRYVIADFCQPVASSGNSIVNGNHNGHGEFEAVSLPPEEPHSDSPGQKRVEKSE